MLFEKINSLDELQPIIELYYRAVQAGNYNEAKNLYRDKLRVILFFQFGAYSTLIEINTAMFENGDFTKPFLENNSSITMLLNDTANCFSLSGHPRRAIPVFDQAKRHAEKIYNKKNVAICLGNLATQQLNLADLESAEFNLRRQIKIAKEIRDLFNDANGHTEAGRLLLFCGNFDTSEHDLNEAIKLWEIQDHTQMIGVSWSYRSLRALIMADAMEALKFAAKALEFAKEGEETDGRTTRDFIVANYYIGASYVAMKDVKNAEPPLNFAITECRKINLVELETPILLELAKLRHLQKKEDESLSLATEAHTIANRCSYVLQQADIEQFLGEFYLDQGDIEKARKYLEDCIEHCTHCWRYSEGEPDFDYVRKEDDFYYVKKEEKWWYRPRWEKANKLLKELEVKNG